MPLHEMIKTAGCMCAIKMQVKSLHCQGQVKSSQARVLNAHKSRQVCSMHSATSVLNAQGNQVMYRYSRELKYASMLRNQQIILEVMGSWNKCFHCHMKDL